MTPEEFAYKSAILSDIGIDLVRKSRELRARSRQIRAESLHLHNKAECVVKRSIAVQLAAQLARGDPDYILKKCGCGKRYQINEWFRLPFSGYQEAEHIGGEMRQCACHSTLLFITRRAA